MKRLFVTFIAVMAILPYVKAEDLIPVRDSADKPVKLIYDTDIGGDIDDALALAILHNMVKRGQIELVGVTITKSNIYAAKFCKAFNIQYGHPDVPIGLIKNGPRPDDGKYARKVIEMKNEDGSAKFPVPADWEPEDSVVLLRKLLAAAEDNSIVIAQVGMSTNLARLMDTPGDDISPLTGMELAAKKVRLVVAMAGAFAFNTKKYENYREYNVIVDIPAAAKFFQEWPGEIVVSGFEIGVDILFPGEAFNADLRIKDSIVRESYRFHRGGVDGKTQPTWDLTCILFSGRPESWRNYFTLSPRGKITVMNDGRFRFTETPDGARRAFICSPEQKSIIREAFINLCTEL
ncbi:MAG: nucleoside hydrolase [Thermoguttaceae bacterium]|nr:nucleoside hydrolase [Thermoguttaceae bacterium]